MEIELRSRWEMQASLEAHLLYRAAVSSKAGGGRIVLER